MNEHIWEGWTVQDFINELEPSFNMIMNNNSHIKRFTDLNTLKQWCMDHQPYYKKHIPKVFQYFKQKANL